MIPAEDAPDRRSMIADAASPRCMYTCHLGCFRRTAIERVGRFRPEFDTAQDYDLALRVVADIQTAAASGG